jgi:hypothetical protein
MVQYRKMLPETRMDANLYHSFRRTGTFLERHARVTAAVLVVVLFLSALVQAAHKPFWYDEIFTYLSAALPGWSGVWNFYASGADTPSPLPALLVHATLRFASNPEITTRIPFMLAFIFMCLCMFVFMRRRYPAAYALAALLAPIALPAFFYYSSEIRAYALVLAGAGLALVCWQSLASHDARGAAANWNIFGLWFGLAFAICAHSFAVFLFVPFALAQLTADLEARKPNLRVWLALLLFPAGILPVLRGLLAASHAYRSTFFARPRLQLLPTVFADMFSPVEISGTMLLFAILVLTMCWPRASSTNAASRTGLTGPEIVFVISLAAMPLYVLPASMLFGVFRVPYVVPAFIGIVLCILSAVAELARRDDAPGVALILALLLLGTGKNSPWSHWRSLARLGHVHVMDGQTFNQQSWVRLVAASSLPVAISDQKLYAQACFYWPDSMKRRLWYPTGFEWAAHYPDAVTEQLNLLRADKFIFFPIMDWQRFSALYPHFLLVVNSFQETWLPSYLAHQPRSQVKIELLGPEFSDPAVYDVQILNPTEPRQSAATGQ